MMIVTEASVKDELKNKCQKCCLRSSKKAKRTKNPLNQSASLAYFLHSAMNVEYVSKILVSVTNKMEEYIEHSVIPSQSSMVEH